MKLILLREHAQRMKKSLGQLADEYVAKRFPITDHAHSDQSSAEQAQPD